jgi:hypothetical protein
MCSTTLKLGQQQWQQIRSPGLAVMRSAFPLARKSEAEVRSLRMDLVVVNNTNGKRRLQMSWRAN